ncbi:MAG: molybdopterin cofactor-binding domain-containing protein [Chloroflexota bacterium]
MTNPGAPAVWGTGSNQLDDWLAIEPDGTVTVLSGKVELGTGVRTALAQIVAEELDVPFERIHIVMGDTARTPDEGFTAGSQTIKMGGSALRKAAAEARRALLDMASHQLDAALDELDVRDGVVTVSHHLDQSITYAELMGGKKFEREMTGDAPLKPPADYRLVGTSMPRVDIPMKMTGQPSFVQDLRIKEMVHGRVVRPPSVGAQFVSLDEGSVQDVSGLIQIVQRGNFVGVVAPREEQAVRAAQQLKVAWRETPSLPRMEDLYSVLRAQQATDDILADDGDVESAMGQAEQQLHATYYQPYHSHASIGPSCAIADVRDEQTTVWCSTQGPFALRGALAQLLGMPVEKVHLMHVEGSGCYGQNGADDVAADAVLLSQAVGKPVRVQWSRADEFVWEPKSAAMVMDVRAGLDAHGDVIAWDYQVWSPSHSARPRFAQQLLAAQLMSGQPAPPTRFYIGGDFNAVTSYAFPNERVAIHWLPSSTLRVSSFRSLGGTGNTFANESFMDELAAAAGADALEFRLCYLHDERAREVLQTAAARAGWDVHPSARTLKDGMAEGRGLAFVQYGDEGAIVACIAFVRVDSTSGAVRVKRIVVAHDCGLIINPDGVKNQIEGNIIQALSRALKEEVQFDEARVTSVDWQTYPILTFSEVPDIEIVLINRPDQPAVGVGEPATVTSAAAVANAIFDATGARVRQVPFTPQRVLAALLDRVPSAE